MKIKGEKLENPIKRRRDTYTIAGGAVISKTQQASFGYYECHFKAAATTMSTTFWLSTRKRFRLDDDLGSYGLELDIQECVGREGDYQGKHFASGMNANSHFWYDNRKERKREDLRAKEVRIPGGISSSAFNTYGGWWKDSKNVTFYFNNGEPHEMKFYDKIKPKPFDQPMGLNMVSETYPYPWIELPTDEELADPTKNTCYYDWVRSYVLVDANDPNTKPIHGMVPEKIELYKETITLDKTFTSSNGTELNIPLSYKTNDDRKLEIQILDSKKKVVFTHTQIAYTGFANLKIILKPQSPLPNGAYSVQASLNGPDRERPFAKDKLRKLTIQAN